MKPELHIPQHRPDGRPFANEALFVDAWISMVRSPRRLALMLDRFPDGALDLRIPKSGPPNNDGKALDFADNCQNLPRRTNNGEICL